MMPARYNAGLLIPRLPPAAKDLRRAFRKALVEREVLLRIEGASIKKRSSGLRDRPSNVRKSRPCRPLLPSRQGRNRRCQAGAPGRGRASICRPLLKMRNRADALGFVGTAGQRASMSVPASRSAVRPQAWYRATGLPVVPFPQSRQPIKNGKVRTMTVESMPPKGFVDSKGNMVLRTNRQRRACGDGDKDRY